MIQRDPKSMSAVLTWWHNMHAYKKTSYRGNRAAVARLHHAGSIAEASIQPAAIELCRALGAQYEDMNTIGLIAAVLAELREDDPTQSIARALGGPDNESRPCKTLRFQRMLESNSADAQLTSFRQILALLKHRGNAADLAASLLEWNDPARRDARRQRWLYDYFHTVNPEQPWRPEGTQ